MTIYVDDAIWPYRGKLYCHMMSDGDIAELHDFAARLGLKRAWFQGGKSRPHYDISEGNRFKAIRLGAVPVSSTEMVRRCMPKREPKELVP